MAKAINCVSRRLRSGGLVALSFRQQSKLDVFLCGACMPNETEMEAAMRALREHAEANASTSAALQTLVEAMYEQHADMQEQHEDLEEQHRDNQAINRTMMRATVVMTIATVIMAIKAVL